MIFKYSFFVQYCDQKWLSTGCDVIAKMASSPQKALTMAKSEASRNASNLGWCEYVLIYDMANNLLACKAIKGDRLVWLNDSELEDAKRESLL